MELTQRWLGTRHQFNPGWRLHRVVLQPRPEMVWVGAGGRARGGRSGAGRGSVC